MIGTAAVVFAGVIVVIGAGVAFYRRPVYGVAALAFVAPFEKISLHAGVTWKPFLPVFFVFALAVLLRHIRGKEPWPALNIVDRVLVFLVLVQLATAVMAIDPGRTVRMTVQFAILYAMLHLAIRYIRTPGEVRFVLFFLFLSAALVVAYGWVQLLGGLAGLDTHFLLRLFPRNPTLPRMLTEPGAVLFPELHRDVVRVSSTFFDWNYFGGYLVFILCLATSLVIRRAKVRGTKSHLVALVLLAVVLLGFTFSRSAWVGAVVAAAFLYRLLRDALPASRRRLGIVAFAVAAVLLDLVLGNPAQLVVGRLASVFQGDPSVARHGIYGRAALEMFSASPVLGIGLHNFPVYFQRFFDPADAGATAHSTFLTYFAETGAVGTLVHLFFHTLVLFILITAFRRATAFSFESCVLAGFLAGYVGILVCNVFYFFNNQAFIWMLLGTGLAQARLVSRWDETWAPAAEPQQAGGAVAVGA